MCTNVHISTDFFPGPSGKLSELEQLSKGAGEQEREEKSTSLCIMVRQVKVWDVFFGKAGIFLY